MESKVRVRFLSRGFRRVLNQRGTLRCVEEVAYGIASRAGHDASVHSFRGDYGGGRHMAVVRVDAPRGDKEGQEAQRALEGAL